jgi:iron complex outermembrane recepter protein
MSRSSRSLSWRAAPALLLLCVGSAAFALGDDGAIAIQPGEHGADTAIARQSTEKSDSDKDSTQSSQLMEIVVTAEKRSERLQDVPISMSVMSGNELDQSTFGGVTEALNTVPGLAAVANQFQEGGTFLAIRGVSAGSSAAGGASTVGYYVDSVPFGMIRSAVLPDPNVYDLQQIEVLRGPQGTLYGANSLNGVVRVLTNDPDLNDFDFKSRGVFSTTQTGGPNYSGDMAANVPIIDGMLAARIVAGDSHESGWIDGPQGTHLNEGELSNIRLKVAAQPADQLSIGLSAWHSQSSYDAPSLSDGNGQNGTLHPEPMHGQFNAYGVNINYQLPVMSISSETSYVDYANPSIVDANPAGLNATYDTTLTSKVLAEEVNLSSKLDGPWRWSAGAMYRHDKDGLDINVELYPQPTTTIPFAHFTDTSTSRAVYGEVGQRFLNDELQWSVGLRYFHDDEGTQADGPTPGGNVPLNVITATSSATTPRAVLTWFAARNLTAYVSFSQGFRSGVPQDELVGSVIPNFAPLKPDKLTNYEMGAKGTLWDGWVSYDAAVFYMKWRDIQQSIAVLDSSNNDVAVLVNGGSASGEGTEFSLKTRPFGGLSLGGNFSWNDLHFNSTTYSGGAVLFYEGSRPNDSPEYTGGLSAHYGFPLGGTGAKGAFSVSGNYISPLNTTFLGSGAKGGNSLLLTQGDFSVQFPSHWTVALFVDNANNYHGTQEPYPGVPQWDTRLRPRTYGVRFDYHLR